MKWLRQQTRVERLSAGATQNAEQMHQLRLQLHQQVRHRLQQPGTLAWSFAAGTLYGAANSRKRDEQPRDERSVSLLRYLNSAAIIWNLMSEFRTDPQAL